MENTNYKGLSENEVLESRERYGENILTPPEKESLWKQFIEKFKDPIIKILLVALFLSLGVSLYEYISHDKGVSVFFEPLGILTAVLLATCIGFGFEVSANRKFEMLNQVNDDTLVKVIRNGSVTEIPRREVVVGDIVVTENGEEIPADGNLLESISLQINESTLTGEPIIKKSVNPSDFKKDSTYPTNMLLKGTTVVDGHGIMEVSLVGDATEYGKVYQGSQIENNIETPLNIQLNRLSTLITYASYAIALIIIVARISLYFINLDGAINWVEAGSFFLGTAMIAITLIVVAVPEGLPMSVTLSLALSMKRMLQNNNLVRKMHAPETMGAATVICTDKTGTLTKNQMRVHKADFHATNEITDDESSTLVTEGIAVNSTAFLETKDNGIKVIGNPTEGALLLWLEDNNKSYESLRKTKILDQLTFSTERKYMATVVNSTLGRKVIYVKGAPEIVFSKCKSINVGSKIEPCENYKESLNETLLNYQSQAMRTLAFAYKFVDNETEYFKDEKLIFDDLTFLGIVAISDPVRDDVPEAIASCLNAGIDVKIVTGDTPATAKEIGRQIGLWNNDTDNHNNHITGIEFAAASDNELLARVQDIKIMSRARPMDKARLVKLLQLKGEVVAVTGDGTNDAPALNAAQIGMSMGDGTSVAKEASAITILDNSFNSISRAVMWGRSLYRNIQRFIIFQVTINVVACFIVMIGAFMSEKTPLTVTQMLWVNLIMDTFAALALASLPPSDIVMKDKPRKTSDHIITPQMGKLILGWGFTFVLILFGLLQYFKQVDITSLTQFSIGDFFANYFNFSKGNGLSSYELSLFFTIFVMMQFWNMFNAKAFKTGASAFKGIGKVLKSFVLVALLIIVGQIFIVTFGGDMFSVVPLKTIDWILIISSTSVILWIGEIYRFFKKTA